MKISDQRKVLIKVLMNALPTTSADLSVPRDYHTCAHDTLRQLDNWCLVRLAETSAKCIQGERDTQDNNTAYITLAMQPCHP